MSLKTTRAQRKPDARRTRSLACEKMKAHQQRHHRFNRISPAFPARSSNAAPRGRLMSDGGPSFDARLDAVARELAGAIDIATVLSVHDEVLKTVVYMRAAEKGGRVKVSCDTSLFNRRT